MINKNVLRVLIAKGAGEGTLRRINRYLTVCSSYSFDDICEDVDLMCNIGISPEISRNIYYSNEEALRLEEKLHNNSISMCWIRDESYPAGLRELRENDAPPVLFYRGRFELLNKKCVGFTGSRNVSDMGLNITYKSAEKLSADGISVVSGYAKGVDITAHMAALRTGGNTVFVIVEGILKNRIKPEIKELLNDKNHLFISQFSPYMQWFASNAMKRNNTIIGLSDAMILIEASMSGGTFNAGEQSLKNNKPLFVVEYGVEKQNAEGNQFFLQHGGTPLRGDRSGMPVLKRVYSVLQNNDHDEKYEQLSLDLSSV